MSETRMTDADLNARLSHRLFGMEPPHCIDFCGSWDFTRLLTDAMSKRGWKSGVQVVGQGGLIRFQRDGSRHETKAGSGPRAWAEIALAALEGETDGR